MRTARTFPYFMAEPLPDPTLPPDDARRDVGAAAVAVLTLVVLAVLASLADHPA